jgi:hypothetical protein
MIDDRASFGVACADAWCGIGGGDMAKATSIGDLLDSMNESGIKELDGAEFKLTML